MSVDYTENGLNTLIYNAVIAVDPTCTVLSRREPFFAEGNTVYVQHRHSEASQHLLLDGSNTAYTWTIDISVYTNDVDGAVTDANDIAAAILTVLKAEYFRLEYANPMDNVDPSIYRLEMRFERLIGEGDKAVNIPEPTGATP